MPDPIQSLLNQGREDAVFPMASLWVYAKGKIHEWYAGKANENTWFDLASLSKPMVVGTLAMRAVSEGLMALDAPISGWGGRDMQGRQDRLKELSWRTLLSHRGGLPAWADFLSPLLKVNMKPESPLAKDARRLMLDMLLMNHEAAARPTYSDIGYILLGLELEKLYQRPLSSWDFLGSLYRPLDHGIQDLARTGYCPFRGREILPGEVHDSNAFAFSGIAGHAGLFGRAKDVGAWALALFLRSQGKEGGPLAVLSPEVIQEFWDDEGAGETGTASSWRLAWDSKSPSKSSAGRYFSEDSVGHLGFTGTSLWIDRRRELIVVFLTNRVALGQKSQAAIKAFRPGLHDLIVTSLGL